MRIVILLNPNAGGGKARRVIQTVIEVLRCGGAAAEVRESRSGEHLVQLAREAAAQQPDILVAAGGDGTVHTILNGIFPTGVPLGIIPIGRGNDFARGLGIPAHPCDAAEVLLRGQVRQVDLARASPGATEPQPGGAASAIYACVAGVGFDSVVNRYANERAHRLHGRFAYAWGIARCLKAYQPLPMKLSSDALNFEGEIIFAVVGNNSWYGDGFRIAPRARLDDGFLDICIVPAMSKWELVRWIPDAHRGTHLAHPRILYAQTRQVRLESPARLEVFADGEFLQDLPVMIDVLPRALHVVAPG